MGGEPCGVGVRSTYVVRGPRADVDLNIQDTIVRRNEITRCAKDERIR